MKIAVLGAGAWGTALAIAFARSRPVALWARTPSHAQALADSRRNARYLPEFELPATITIETDLARALGSAQTVVIATPMAGLRVLLQALPPCNLPVVLACKGFEPASGLLAHEVSAAVRSDSPVCVLSGPSFAHEVAANLTTAVVLASTERALAERLARDLHGARLRIYSNDDLVGVEVAGAAKNVLAIAAGICDGLGLGMNARAALVTRGLAEISRLGTALGGRLETFVGLAGVGDVILTCTGALSRNRQVGLALAAGEPLERTLQNLGHVAEGVSSAFELARRAASVQVDMPISRAVCAVLEGRMAPASAVETLLERGQRSEF